jgi:hypothetical protein
MVPQPWNWVRIHSGPSTWLISDLLISDLTFSSIGITASLEMVL